MTRRQIIDYYTDILTRVDEEAQAAPSYGGHLRKTKGKLLEDLTEAIVHLAWKDANGEMRRLSIGDKKTFKIYVQRKYISNLPEDLRQHIEHHINEHYYRAQVDKHIFVDGQLVLGGECKAYAENAMLKRILLDFNILKMEHPDLVCCLLQLESMLGGDYSDPLASRVGSAASHALMSLFPNVHLHIVTLLEGERRIDQPIHKPQYFKELQPVVLDHAIGRMRTLLQPFV